MGFSAGVLIQISFMELLFSAITETGFLNANIAFFVGILTITAIEFLIPHEYEEEKLTEKEKKNKRLMKTGLLVSAGIVIHNFPEGILTLFGTIKDPHLGLVLLIAIALHNIPKESQCQLQSTTQQKTGKRHLSGLFSRESLSQSEHS